MLFLESALEGPVWERVVFDNTLAGYAEALVMFFVALVVLKIVQVVVLKRFETLSKKTKTDIDDLLVGLARAVRPSFYVALALYVGIRALTLTAFVTKGVNIILLIWIVWQSVRFAQVVIDHFVSKKTKSDVASENATRFLSGIVKFILWVVGLLLILQNAGVNVTSLITGLGIGGIAVAFALQNILEDLFSSFSIYFDKPFEVGDVIKVGEHVGEVEKVGIKTTRIRSLVGEEIIVANKQLTTTILQNFKRLDERRVSFQFGVVYEIDNEKLSAIPDMIKIIIDEAPHTRFARAHFREFGDSALLFEVTYYVESDEYDIALDTQQKINLAIREKFAKEKIEMAYPTRTIYMTK